MAKRMVPITRMSPRFRHACARQLPIGYGRVSVVLAVASVISLVGCGSDSSPRRAIYGNVRVDAIEDVNGSISFFPTDGNRGPATSTAIVSGSYEFTKENGPYAGPHRVMVGIAAKQLTSASQDSSAAADEALAEGKQVLMQIPDGRRADKAAQSEAAPRQWNTKFNVPADGDPRKDFAFSNASL